MPCCISLFQSTPPSRGATLTPAVGLGSRSRFQSTPPSRGATYAAPRRAPRMTISIHAPLAGGDLSRGAEDSFDAISIHAPLAGGDDISQALIYVMCISIHAPLAGGDSKSAQVWSVLLFKAENISGDYTALGVLYRIFFPKTTLPQGNFRCEGAGAGVGAWASHAAGQIISVPSGR